MSTQNLCPNAPEFKDTKTQLFCSIQHYISQILELQMHPRKASTAIRHQAWGAVCLRLQEECSRMDWCCGNMAEFCWPTAAQTDTSSLAAWQKTEREQQPTSRPCIIHQGCISLRTARQSSTGRRGHTRLRAAMKLPHLNHLWRDLDQPGH